MPTKDKIYQDRYELKTIVKQWKTQGKKVVFTNGCFDIIHLGHIDYLEKTAETADFMVVAVNSDESVRKLKGEERPINNEYARMRMLAALEFVDAVIPFGEDTPLELIKLLLPNILVKGDDYQIADIVGGKEVIEAGGEVKTIPLVQGYSTSKIIEKIRS